MSGNEAFTPIEVRAPRGARVMHVAFEDGHEGVYPHELLRGYCPCAQCQGHSGPIRFVPGGDLELVDIAEVGNYALRLTWGDGHSTGIYSFRFLRELCACEQCAHGRRSGAHFFALIVAHTIDETMAAGEQDQAREQFLAEAQELVEGLSRDVLHARAGAAGREPNPELLNDLFRGVHTLKGLSGMFDYREVGRLAHVLEDLLEQLRMGRVALTPDDARPVVFGHRGVPGLLASEQRRRDRLRQASMSTDRATRRGGDASARPAGSRRSTTTRSNRRRSRC